MSDIGERFARESASGVAVNPKGGGFLGRGEGVGQRLGLSAKQG